MEDLADRTPLGWLKGKRKKNIFYPIQYLQVSTVIIGSFVYEKMGPEYRISRGFRYIKKAFGHSILHNGVG